MVMVKATNKNQAYLDLDDRYVNPVLARTARIVAERAQGSYIYDMNGDAYLDLAVGIAVNNVGHCHPRVVAAIQKQCAELIHTSVTTHHKRYIELSQKLVQITPAGLDSVFLANSGAEAVEGAIKLARYVTNRPGTIIFKGSFHGRTLLTTALTTSKLYYREKYEPLPGSIFTVPYPYVFRSDFPNDSEACVNFCLAELDDLFHRIVHPEQIAAIMIEPVQGEGGYIVPPHGFIQQLRKIADEHGILLICDEVQSGFGRTGKMFAIEHEPVEPDILLMAKGIAGGMPLSAFVSKRQITSQWKPGRHGSTFGGNPVSCAAALATIDVLQEEGLCERAAKVGDYMLKELKRITKTMSHVGEVRGLGLMIGIDFSDLDGKPSKEMAERTAEKCLEHKMIALTCGSQGQVMRLMPPLNISDADVEKALNILEKSLALK
jgi:4-aminobutyrate aminotransferase